MHEGKLCVHLRELNTNISDVSKVTRVCSIYANTRYT